MGWLCVSTLALMWLILGRLKKGTFRGRLGSVTWSNSTERLPPPPYSLCLWRQQSRVEDHSLLVHDMLTHEPNSDQSCAPCCGPRFGLGITVRLLPAPWICMSGNRKKNKTLLVIAFFLFCNAKSLILSCYMIIQVPFLCLRDHQPSAQVIAHIDLFVLFEIMKKNVKLHICGPCLSWNESRNKE